MKESGKYIDLAKKKFSFYTMAQFLMFIYFIVWTFIVQMSPLDFDVAPVPMLRVLIILFLPYMILALALAQIWFEQK